MSPTCVQCTKVFHPDFCVVVDEQTNVCKCVFCYMNKSEVTIEGANGEIVDRINKKEAHENYIRYLKDLKNKPAVRKVLYGNPMSKIIQ